jgi:hypothetical protein
MQHPLPLTFDQEILGRFVRNNPLAAGLRLVLEQLFSAAEIDALFEVNRDQQYTRKIAFSTIVDVMAAVVTGHARSVHAVLEKRKTTLGASITVFYDKLNGSEPAVAAALIACIARKARALLMKGLEPQHPTPNTQHQSDRARRRGCRRRNASSASSPHAAGRTAPGRAAHSHPPPRYRSPTPCGSGPASGTGTGTQWLDIGAQTSPVAQSPSPSQPQRGAPASPTTHALPLGSVAQARASSGVQTTQRRVLGSQAGCGEAQCADVRHSTHSSRVSSHTGVGAAQRGRGTTAIFWS